MRLNFLFVYLDSNKIKFLNDRLFERLTKLSLVHLEDNDCVTENFNDKTQVAAMIQAMNGKCGFKERNEFELVSCDSKSFYSQLQSKSDEITQNLIKIARLEERVNAAEAAEVRAEGKVTLIKEIYETFEVQRNKICSAKAEEMRHEIDENKRKIQTLEEKFSALSTKCNF